MGISVTIAICTWNRHALLRQTLQQMTLLRIPSQVRWELLIVNNNCSDATDAVISEFSQQLPIRRVFQPVPGLSNARNLASLESRGDYVIWTDDDVLVAPEWLEEYVNAFGAYPDAAIFGGPIRPWFPNSPPLWLEQAWEQVSNAYASIDYGEIAVPLSSRRVPFGANMAVRMDCVARYPYDPHLGVRPGSRMGGEETDVIRRALSDGHTGWWIPSAGVQHYIPPERQTLKYLRKWFYAYGMYLGRHLEAGRRVAHLFGRPRWLWKQMLVTEMRYQMYRHLGEPKVWMAHMISASIARGQMRAYKSQSRGAYKRSRQLTSSSAQQVK
ncbi:MAG: glycosyltransferase [Phycisphaerae bacterium]|nr:glycosyltransferase [Gemmatimonadaceae bacterium]